MSDRLLDTLTSTERTLYDSWDKEDVYEAFVSERAERVKLNKLLNEERQKLKEIEWKMKDILKTSY